MKYIIDRIEGNFAVCEDETGAMINIPTERIEGEWRESCALYDDDGIYRVIADERDNRALFDRLFKKK